MSEKQMQQAEHRAEPMTKEVFCALVSEYQGTLYNVAVAILGNRADCQDAMQEAVLQAWRSIGSLRQPQYFKTWLTRILINRCRWLLRRRSNAPVPLLESLDAPAPDDDAQALRAAVDALPDRLRPVIVLYYYEDFAVDDIARALAIPRGTVLSRLSRGRDALRKALL